MIIITVPEFYNASNINVTREKFGLKRATSATKCSRDIEMSIMQSEIECEKCLRQQNVKRLIEN